MLFYEPAALWLVTFFYAFAILTGSVCIIEKKHNIIILSTCSVINIMALNPSAQDIQILDYVVENYTCKICNNILIQCVTLSCEHNYCSYCLDVLGAASQSCPQCSLPIRHAQPNVGIDQEIDELIHSCSEPIQKAYATALDFRFQKQIGRSKAKKGVPRSFDDVCKHIPENFEARTLHCCKKTLAPLQSARFPSTSTSTTCPRRKGKISVESLKTDFKKSASSKTSPHTASIDVNKVNQLFGIYDHVLNAPVRKEPKEDMSGGDFARDYDFPMSPSTEGMTNYTKRSEQELASLIQETEDIIQLDSHIHQWTTKMRRSLNGSTEEQAETVGLADSQLDPQMHQVNDKLWKASYELLQKLRGVKEQRQTQKVGTRGGLATCVIPAAPLPRSVKLDIEAISDDSDAEEYKAAMESVILLLKTSEQPESAPLAPEQSSLPPSESIDNSKAKDKPMKAKSARSKGQQKVVSQNRKSTSSLIEESGNAYVRENITFITQMRKYKDALLKIQNHEVETADEIKELLPSELSFALDDKKFNAAMKSGGTPRNLSQVLTGKIGPRSGHSLSARAPAMTTPQRPITPSYDMPSSPQLIPRSDNGISAKRYLKRNRSGNLYTAR